MAAVLSQVAERMADNYPYFHPLYAGQMLKPPHPLARAAYALAMIINPNNHALMRPRQLPHGSRGSGAAQSPPCWLDGVSRDPQPAAEPLPIWRHSGSPCQLAPGKRIVASAQAHYTHGRISGVLGLPFATVPADRGGRMDMAARSSPPCGQGTWGR